MASVFFTTSSKEMEESQNVNVQKAKGDIPGDSDVDGGQPRLLHLECQPPSKLHFRGNFRSATTVTMRVKNCSHQHVIFKLRTTAPHRYMVKPHKGEIAAHSESLVVITLLPFLYNSSHSYNDKFMLLACAYSKQNANYSKHDFWSMVPKNELYQRKFVCVFEQTTKDEDDNSDDDDDDDAEDDTPREKEAAESNDVVLAGAEVKIMELTEEKAALEKRNQVLRNEFTQKKERILSQDREAVSVHRPDKRLENGMMDYLKQAALLLAALILGVFIGVNLKDGLE